MTSTAHDRPVDEQTLAALLAGTLPEAQRQRVLARLACDPEARIVLQMAMEAIEALQIPELAIASPAAPDAAGRQAA